MQNEGENLFVGESVACLGEEEVFGVVVVFGGCLKIFEVKQKMFIFVLLKKVYRKFLQHQKKSEFL